MSRCSNPHRGDSEANAVSIHLWHIRILHSTVRHQGGCTWESVGARSEFSPPTYSIVTLGKLLDIFFKDFIYLFRDGGKEKERERNIDQLPLACAPSGDQACNPGMCSGLMPNQLSHTSQGNYLAFLCLSYLICKMNNFKKYYPN